MSEETEWKPDYSVTPRRIVCAANRHRESGLILCGARHWDKVMRAQVKAVGISPQDGWDQGFLDQFADFLTREEAWIVAEEQNQIRRRCGGDGKRLYSENCW